MLPRILIATAFLALLRLSACSPGSAAEIDKMVNIGTHSLHIRCTGRGRPTVVIDTGVGDTSERWQSFQAQVAQVTRVCTYDRAGYGASEPGPLPRHSQRAADELKQLLENAGVRGPYVLVGHSLGGLNAQVEYVVVTKCGHFWHECPDAFYPCVRAFLDVPPGP